MRFSLCVCALVAYTSLHGVVGAESSFDEALQFLKEHQPPIDVGLSEDYLEENVRLALKARDDHPWAQNVPWEMFLNDVLPYASLNEPRDPWRPMFYEKFSPLVKNATTLTEAGQLLNQHIWSQWSPPIHFVSDCTPDIMSPFQTIKAGHASCTGLSIFLVNALRSVGVPARVVGTPNWNTATGGNHDWTELWDGVWSFTGSCEYNPTLNSTWFFPSPAKSQLPGQDNCSGHSIFASSWAPFEGDFFPMVWEVDDSGKCLSNSTYINAVDRTQVYVALANERETLWNRIWNLISWTMN